MLGVSVAVWVVHAVGGGSDVNTPGACRVMPVWLGKQNAKGVLANALWVTSGMVQLRLILTLWSKASYLALLSLSIAMISIPHFFSACHRTKLAWTAGSKAGNTGDGSGLSLLHSV